MALLRLAAFLSLACLSGCWVAFFLRPPSMSWWTKLFVGAALSPLILVIEFYALRLVGISFDQAGVALALLNGLALFPVLIGVAGLSRPRLAAAAGACFVLATTFFALAPQLSSPNAIIYSTHSWMHAAADYMVANGELALEEPSLAGVRLAYPWGGYVFQALLSYSLNSAPAYSYAWTNVLWILLLYGLAVVLASEIGLTPLSAVFAPIWLFFGVNFANELLTRVVGRWIHLSSLLSGDLRYANWIWYFMFPSQMVFAVAMLLAILIILVRNSLWVRPARDLTLVVLLLVGIGIFYPVLFPAAAVAPLARIAAELINRDRKRRVYWKPVLMLLVATSIGTLVAVGNLAAITRDRKTAALLVSNMGPQTEFFHSGTPVGKAVEYLAATSTLWVALALTIRRLWAAQRTTAVVFAIGGLASALLYVTLSLPYYQNEYKFVFTGASCFFLFPAILVEPVFNRIGNKALGAGMLLTLVLAAPLIVKMYRYPPFWITHGPQLQAGGFDLRLAGSERLADLTDAIRTRTPIETVIVADDMGVYLPALTRRPLFVAVKSPNADPGVAIPNDTLLRGVKGYDSRLIDRRQSIQYVLFHSDNRAEVTQSLGEALALKRPIVVLLDARLHPALPRILRELGCGQLLLREHDLEVWLFRPSPL